MRKAVKAQTRRPSGNPNGRPSFEPTEDDRKTVSLMASVGIAHAGIALCIEDGIDLKTLRKYFPLELATAAIKADARVAGSLYQAAISGNVQASIWWTRSRMGWKDKSVHEHTGSITLNRIHSELYGASDKNSEEDFEKDS